MKYVIIIPDGCADQPLEPLGGKTPLEVANIPHMDAVACDGAVALTDNVPRHFPAGSEVANMTLFGYDPNQYFTGRAPIEAAARGIQLGKYDWAVRCNLVTVDNQIMVDFTADHISTDEAAELLKSLSDKVNSLRASGADDGTSIQLDPSYTLEFVTGVSYRNLLIVRGNENSPPLFSTATRSHAPHDLTDLPVEDDYPRGPGSDLLVQLMQLSANLLKDHPVNQRRIEAGKRPATNVWLWGLGGSPDLPSYRDRFGLSGAMITAVDLLRGLAALVGWDRIEVEGATGYLDTNYVGKGQAAVAALDQYDIVCVHIEATDEASHEGRYDEKIKALEEIDRHIVAPVRAKLESLGGPYRLAVLPDHPTPCSTKKHSHGWVPMAVCGSGISASNATYNEPAAEQTSLRFPNGWEMMQWFLDL